ncbi:LLM class F420-dependent oxidoreductase [Saccharopolyspora sp. NPDC050389]|uniref:LLM class F420-dependent oxidoreductase n=1 Tax=Saccharopolyspora sp. NPDC050389 TaxID=3155516 RepID=UPI0033D69E90
MRYAVMAPVAAGVTARPDWMGEFARHAEACGFESIVAVEHAVVVSRYSSVYPYASSGKMELADDCDIPDPLDLLMFLAAHTTRIELATGVLVLPNHHPVVLAKRAATLDALSGGRLRLCIGMGWMREEIEACGAEFETRGKRADEQIDVLRKLWTDRSPTGVDHDGRFFSFAGAMTYPKPARAGGIPIHIGGHSRAAARRAGRRGDGLQPLGVGGAELQQLIDLMRQEAEAADRDPDALEVTLGHLVSAITTEKAESLAARGASRIMLQPTPTTDLAAVKDELSACAQRLGLAGR